MTSVKLQPTRWIAGIAVLAFAVGCHGGGPAAPATIHTPQPAPPVAADAGNVVPTEAGDPSPSPTTAGAEPSASDPPPTNPDVSSAQGRVLWDGDARRGTAVFEGLERQPGTIEVVDDPDRRYGPTFRITTTDHPDVKDRCETRGMRLPNGAALRIDDAYAGQTLYLGWRARWGPMPTSPGRWTALFQLHLSGEGLTGAGPVAIRTLGDGSLRLQLIAPGLFDRDVWSTPLPTGTWNTFVLAIHVSRSPSTGWVRLWYNGLAQTFTDGTPQYAVPTLIGDHVNPKWGVYRSGAVSGPATAYLQGARLATSYAAVAP